MITPAQRRYAQERAYVPEHLPAYVRAVSGAEPFLSGDFIFYVEQKRLIFVGYPLSGQFDPDRMTASLNEATGRFEPRLISLTAPTLPPGYESSTPDDSYYRLPLARLALSQKLRNMLKRAGREVLVQTGHDFGPEHQALVDQFLQAQPLDEATRFIFRRIPAYMETGLPLIFEARNPAGELVAFDVADFSAGQYAFYMFNFYSRRLYVPGASDLLLFKLMERAGTGGKKYLNLGLGINDGVTFFKTKWGGRPFLPHVACTQERGETGLWQAIFDML